jgi:hypothetical protein
MAFVTNHAAQRCIERFDRSLDVDQAKELIMRSAATIDAAAKFGASSVKLAKGIICLTAETQSASYLLAGAELAAMAGS